jgi:hypothetical protein
MHEQACATENPYLTGKSGGHGIREMMRQGKPWLRVSVVGIPRIFRD